ncbi:hypothetical protein FSP39_006737 [Pinctada imbricata]|uniref:HTH myb-type domain-containing protein n=1 Tax=Pinctada imbricata TaxID=66713 RepID=A0AA89CBX6_PINIB|nr:hypothetical protein FSP39_006737 [Pinctada imbricata]
MELIYEERFKKKKKRNKMDVDHNEEEPKKKERKRKLNSLINVALSQSELDTSSDEDRAKTKTERKKVEKVKKKGNMDSLLQSALSKSDKDFSSEENSVKRKNEEDHLKKSMTDEDKLNRNRKERDFSKMKNYSKEMKEDYSPNKGKKGGRLDDLVQLALNQSDIESDSEEEKGRTSGDNLRHFSQVNDLEKGQKALPSVEPEKKSEGKKIRLSINRLLYNNCDSEESEEESSVCDINKKSSSEDKDDASTGSLQTELTNCNAGVSVSYQEEGISSVSKQNGDLQHQESLNCESHAAVNSESRTSANCESHAVVNCESRTKVNCETHASVKNSKSDSSIAKSLLKKRKKPTKKLAIKFNFQKSPESSSAKKSLGNVHQERELEQKNKTKTKHKSDEVSVHESENHDSLTQRTQAETVRESSDQVISLIGTESSSRDKGKKSPSKRKQDTIEQYSSRDFEDSNLLDTKGSSPKRRKISHQDVSGHQEVSFNKKIHVSTNEDVHFVSGNKEILGLRELHVSGNKEFSGHKEVSGHEERLGPESLHKMFSDSSDSEADQEATGGSSYNRQGSVEAALAIIGDNPLDSGMGSDGEQSDGHSNVPNSLNNSGNSVNHSINRAITSDNSVDSSQRGGGILMKGSVMSCDSVTRETNGIWMDNADVVDKDRGSQSTRPSLEVKESGGFMINEELGPEKQSQEKSKKRKKKKKKKEKRKILESEDMMLEDNLGSEEQNLQKSEKKKKKKKKKKKESEDLMIEDDRSSEEQSQEKSEMKMKKKKKKEKERRNLEKAREAERQKEKNRRDRKEKRIKEILDEEQLALQQSGPLKCSEADLEVSDEVCAVIHASDRLDAHKEKQDYIKFLRNGYQRLPWKEIARDVPGRTAVQCRHHFNQCLYHKHVMGRTFSWTSVEMDELRRIIFSQEPNQSSQIRWDEVREVMGKQYTVSFLKLQWNRMVRNIPGHKQLPFKRLCLEVKEMHLPQKDEMRDDMT